MSTGMTPLDMEIANIMLSYIVRARERGEQIPMEAAAAILGYTVRILRKNGYNDIADVISRRFDDEHRANQ